MSLKHKIIDLLLSSGGEYMSGEYIATSLNVTRAAVWKNIKQLEKEGFEIRAVTNKGYTIVGDNDVLTENGIRRYINAKAPFQFEIHDSVKSTNLLMREKSSADEGLVIISREQTAGIGRYGRDFFSPKDTGIYISLLLKPNLDTSQSIFITTMAAVAVCQAISNVTNLEAKIKWVNDIYLKDKKICGILTQGSFSMENNHAEYIILGIGLNIYTPWEGFPSEIEDKAGVMLDHCQFDFKNKITAEILNRFWDMYKNTSTTEIADRYKSLSCVIGKEILVHKLDTTFKATVMDINERCNLVIKSKKNGIETLSSGEISISL